MTQAEAELKRLGVSPAQAARAEALFDATAPRGLKAANHPFHRWLDQTQRYFLKAANG